jgi:dolichyl-phosphate-mannose-protein mannosyltransferase
MSSPPASLRKRAGKKNESPLSSANTAPSSSLKKAQTAPKASRVWDYKLALVIMTLLAFATRFYRINHPDEVVFDEVHFGKVSFLAQLRTLAPFNQLAPLSKALRSVHRPMLIRDCCT